MGQHRFCSSTANWPGFQPGQQGIRRARRLHFGDEHEEYYVRLKLGFNFYCMMKSEFAFIALPISALVAPSTFAVQYLTVDQARARFFRANR